MTTRAIERLTRLLEVERIALLEGDFETVGALIDEKEALVVSFGPENRNDLRLLSVALTHNSALFSASLEGVSTVVETMRQQSAARTKLSGYDSSGKPTEISRTTPATERRY